MTLDNDDSVDGLHLVPGSFGMNVPTSCTIVIIAGVRHTGIKPPPSNVL